jgi:calcineurin-like phosphoesterase family protein
MKVREELIYEPNKTQVISDTHFGHDNVLKFEAGYHNFANIEDHDKTIVTNWFATVYDDKPVNYA